MRKVHVTYYTDPYCPWSWVAEPNLRRLEVEFGEQVAVTFVIVGLARQIDADRGRELALSALDASAESGMPADPRVFLREAPASTYPAALAVCAVADQADPGPYLRRLREAILLERRPMDRPDALLDAARELAPAALDLERLRVDFGSNAIVERFGGHLERARAVPAEHHGPAGRVRIPSIEVEGGGAVHGPAPYEAWREAVRAAGAEPRAQRPAVVDLLVPGRRTTAPEIAAACDLPRPRAEAELWRLAGEWRARPEPVLGGHVWRPA